MSSRQLRLRVSYVVLSCALACLEICHGCRCSESCNPFCDRSHQASPSKATQSRPQPNQKQPEPPPCPNFWATVIKSNWSSSIRQLLRRSAKPIESRTARRQCSRQVPLLSISLPSPSRYCAPPAWSRKVPVTPSNAVSSYKVG